VTGGSLGRRLLLGAGLWIAVALLVSGVALDRLFTDHVTAAFDGRIAADLNQLAGNLQPGAAGQPVLARRLADPDFERPYSGRYWQAVAPGGQVLSSRSVWDSGVALPQAAATEGAAAPFEVAGPSDQRLRGLARAIALPGADGVWRIAVAGDRAAIGGPARAFRTTLMLALGILGLGLMIAVLLQVRIGLQPLARLRAALAALRSGRRRRLADTWPAEIAPLIRDFDGVLDTNDQVLERARTQAANLAHALKTPLSVLANAGAGSDAPLARDVIRETATMRRHIDHHLARARAAAAVLRPGAAVDAAGAARPLVRALQRLHAERGLDIALIVEGAPVFRGEAEDLMEMIGNLADNACTWARARVRITVAAIGAEVVLTVEDDGPGIPGERRDEVLARGVRLDESVPGSGLGLAIVRDLAELHGGTVTLDRSALGGACVRLRLPAGGQPGTGAAGR